MDQFNRTSGFSACIASVGVHNTGMGYFKVREWLALTGLTGESNGQVNGNYDSKLCSYNHFPCSNNALLSLSHHAVVDKLESVST